jgi:Small-conductance mechanosensitive channel
MSRFLVLFLVLFAVSLSAQEDEPPPGEPGLPLIVPKDGLEVAAEGIADAADAAADSVGHPWLARDVYRGIPASRLAATLLIILAVAALAGVLAWVIRLRSGRIRSGERQSWSMAMASAVRKPLALLIWSYGLYLAALPSIGALADADEQARAAAIAGRLADIGGLIAVFWLVFRSSAVLQKKMHEWAARSDGFWDKLLVEIASRVMRLALPLVAAILLLPLLNLPPVAGDVIQKAIGMFLIVGIATLVIRSTTLFEKALLARHRIDVDDNLEARKIYTQVSVIRKIIVAVVIILAIGSTLMMFSVVRQLGTSILASAGIAGIVLGFAAQKTLGNLLAGIQIAISQPIRIDDVVIVEGEWGRIEEITLTYVVVKIWDLRRLVLPITWFVENPFQNWTRHESRILGTVFLYVDYAVPVGEVRAELRRLCEASEWWDRDVCGLQVTNSTERALELRCLASAADASRAWNLRCELREGLVAWIARNHPDSLPRFRAELPGTAPAATG